MFLIFYLTYYTILRTGELLNLFIKRIEVGEREERYSRKAEQAIIIHYRDIGVISAFAEEADKIAV